LEEIIWALLQTENGRRNENVKESGNSESIGRMRKDHQN
jgi:hypothetical protein